MCHLSVIDMYENGSLVNVRGWLIVVFLGCFTSLCCSPIVIEVSRLAIGFQKLCNVLTSAVPPNHPQAAYYSNSIFTSLSLIGLLIALILT